MTNMIKKFNCGITPKNICGAPMFNDTERDLYLHGGFPGESCFVVANVIGDDGNVYNFFVHHGAMQPDGGGSFKAMVTMVSLTDKANRQYLHTENIYPFQDCVYSSASLDIKTPGGSLRGNSRQMKLWAELPDGRGSIHAELENCGPTLNNCGGGKFLCMNDLVEFNHYGLPYLKAKGNIIADGRKIAFEGDAWLDRQWGSGNLPLIMANHKIQTKWMDLNLSNGYKVSLWDIIADGGTENSWVTILSPDGVHIISPMIPLAENESDYWYSEKTGNYYATKYIVRMPAVNTEIKVSVYDGIPQQEAVSVSGYNRYEAHCDCGGVFMGQQVTGFCCVELVGAFGAAKQ